MFRAESLAKGIDYIGIMFGNTTAGMVDETFWFYLVKGGGVLVLGIIFSLPVLPWLRGKAIWRRMEPFVAVVVFVLSLLTTITATYSPFIYFNF